MPKSIRNCEFCGKAVAAFDTHKGRCYNCKKCSALYPCEECMLWPPENWEMLSKRAERRSRSRERKLRGGPKPAAAAGSAATANPPTPTDIPAPLSSPAAPLPSAIPLIPDVPVSVINPTVSLMSTVSTPSNLITVSTTPPSVNSTTVNATSDSLSSIMNLIESRFSQMTNSITMLSQRVDVVSQAQVLKTDGRTIDIGFII